MARRGIIVNRSAWGDVLATRISYADGWDMTDPSNRRELRLLRIRLWWADRSMFFRAVIGGLAGSAAGLWLFPLVGGN